VGLVLPSQGGGETGSINRTPTLGKIRKDMDSHFHGNDRKDKKREERDIDIPLIL